MIYTIWLLAGAVIGALAVFLAGRPALKRYEQTESGLKNEIEAKNGQLFELNRQVAESRTQCRALEERIALLQQTYEREELRRKEEETSRMQQQQAAFKNLANDILEEKSRQMKPAAADLLREHQQILTWAELFDSAAIGEKKVIASYLIKAVTLTRGYGIQVDFNISEAQFLNGLEMG